MNSLTCFTTVYRWLWMIHSLESELMMETFQLYRWKMSFLKMPACLSLKPIAEFIRELTWGESSCSFNCIHFHLSTYWESYGLVRVLAEKLDLKYEEAERWIVNLIRTSKLDAKIDSESGTVIMEPTQPNV